MEEAGKVTQQQSAYFFDKSDVINISSYNNPNEIIVTLEWRKIEKLTENQRRSLAHDLKEILDEYLGDIEI